MAVSTVVIKVKYGDVVKRFSAQIFDGLLVDFNMGGLRLKILNLFNFAPDTLLTLTYTDLHDAEVTLADDADLREAVKQGLNPLCITLKLNTEKNASPYVSSGGNSTWVNPPFQNVKPIVDLTKSAFRPLSQNILSPLPLNNAQFAAPLSYPQSMPRCTFPNGSLMGPYFNNQSPFSTSLVGSGPAIPPYSASQVRPINPNDIKGGSLEASSSKACGAVNVGKPFVGSIGETVGVDPKPRAVPVSLSPPLNSSNLNYPPTKILNPVSCPSHLPAYVPLGVWNGPRPMNEISSSLAPSFASHIKTFHQYDGSVNFFHRGVQCKGCWEDPVTGPRFKSKVKADYDLCSSCFEKKGNDHDYIRIDRSMAYRHPTSINALHGLAIGDGNAGAIALVFDSSYVRDVNIVDGTVMAPLTPFTKIWMMKNNGIRVWPQKTQLVWVGGDKLNNMLAIDIMVGATGVPVGMDAHVAVDFIAPQTPGRYISYWRMASPTGQKFGQRIWVLIQVDDSVKPNNEQKETKFPINGNLLVGTGGGYHSAPSTPPSSPSIPSQTSSRQVYLNKEVLRKQLSVDDRSNDYEFDPMLEELHKMGFDDTDLNMELLEKYDGSISRVVMDLSNTF